MAWAASRSEKRAVSAFLPAWEPALRQTRCMPSESTDIIRLRLSMPILVKKNFSTAARALYCSTRLPIDTADTALAAVEKFFFTRIGIDNRKRIISVDSLGMH